VSELQSVLDRQAADQRARAIRTLLARPLLTRTADPATFAHVVTHHSWLQGWFDDFVGWQLHVEPRRGYARLVKRRHDPDPTRPARRPRGARAPFDRRRYVLLCVTLAELARGQAQTVVGQLAGAVQTACATDDQLDDFDTASHPHRTAFVDVLKTLETWQILEVRSGDADTYRNDPDAQVLYDIDETRLVRLLAADLAPSRAPDGTDPILQLTGEPRYGTDPAGDHTPERVRNRYARHRLLRRLLDDPVVYPHELDPAEAAYVASPTGERLVRSVLDEAGLTLETRADGWVVIDPDAHATLPDDRFPDERSQVKHAALLLLECASGARFGPGADPATHGPPAAPNSRLEEYVTDLMGRFPDWAKKYQGDHGAPALVRDACQLLVAHKLAAPDPNTLLLLPAAARYASLTAAQLTAHDDLAGQHGPDQPAAEAALALPFDPPEPT
jgi:uncharacterized protein (TIGR02678 family)